MDAEGICINNYQEIIIGSKLNGMLRAKIVCVFFLY
jgi:hypothetical protein